MWQVDASLSAISKTSSEPPPGEFKPTVGRVKGREVVPFPLRELHGTFTLTSSIESVCGSLLQRCVSNTLRRVKCDDNIDLCFQALMSLVGSL